MSNPSVQLVSLLGKDYFTLTEAAFYVGVSERQFDKEYKKLGISSFKYMGKKLFRRDEIQASIEKERGDSLKA